MSASPGYGTECWTRPLITPTGNPISDPINTVHFWYIQLFISYWFCSTYIPLFPTSSCSLFSQFCFCVFPSSLLTLLKLFRVLSHFYLSFHLFTFINLFYQLQAHVVYIMSQKPYTIPSSKTNCKAALFGIIIVFL
jgi:hypothetical protein